MHRYVFSVLACLSLAACASDGAPPRRTPPGDRCPHGFSLVCFDKEAPESGPVVDDRFCRCERVLDMP
ncbi:MAG: hypothetical protein OEW35_05460 [Gammaproteobacteria bacterium]|nr:hypothetical protein [Gammaproteobacteria bacterium]MDH4253076.1 hypothetical protein [Gammaproteobacteria bacterium]MDH5308902.1 hypothetical protein [Gammaproteobacteria bacterium]